MKYTNTPVSAPESTILAADTYVAIPFTVKETNAVPLVILWQRLA